MAAARRPKKSLTATPAKKKPVDIKWIVVVGFILSTMVTTGVTWWSSRESAKYQAQLAERIVQVNRFSDAAQAFDPIVVKFIKEVEDGKVSSATRDTIKTNLMLQRSILENAGSLLDGNKARAANLYVEALVKASDGLSTATGPLDSRAFVQAAADIAALRPDLLKELRAE